MSITSLERKLKEKQIQPTAMRLRVLEYLLEQHAAVSLNDIEKGLQHTDRVTVYRTLKTFEENSLVHSIEDGTGATKYAMCYDDCEPGGRHHDLHVHFYCRKCEETFCLPKSAIPALQLPAGYEMEEMNLTVKGICSKCNQ